MLIHWLEPSSCFQAIPIHVHMGHTTVSAQKYAVTNCQINFQPLSSQLCVHILHLWNNAVYIYTWIESGVPRINTYPMCTELALIEYTRAAMQRCSCWHYALHTMPSLRTMKSLTKAELLRTQSEVGVTTQHLPICGHMGTHTGVHT